MHSQGVNGGCMLPASGNSLCAMDGVLTRRDMSPESFSPPAGVETTRPVHWIDAATCSCREEGIVHGIAEPFVIYK